MGAGPVADAVGHAAHDLGVLGAGPAVNGATPTGISVFTADAQSAIDAVNADGGFGGIFPMNGTTFDVSANGNIMATDSAGGGSLYWTNYWLTTAAPSFAGGGSSEGGGVG
jgi:hypothetical protein